METYAEAITAFNNLLDDSYEEVQIGSGTFFPSSILLHLDPIAYRCDFLDWLDSEGIDSDDLEGEYPY